jgi:hypothetical protein
MIRFPRWQVPDFALLFLLLMNSQFIFVNGSSANPLEVPYLQEAYCAVLIAYATLSLGVRARVYTLTLYAFVALAVTVSAIFALIEFNQPLIFGFIEERRIFLLLSFFPIVHVLSRKDYDFERFATVLYAAAFIVFCVLMYGQATLRTDQLGSNIVREGRITQAGMFFGLTGIIAILSFLKQPRIIHAVVFAIASYELIFITQTRSMVVAYLLTSALCVLTTRNGRRIALLSAVPLLLTAAAVLAVGLDPGNSKLLAFYVDPSLTYGSITIRSTTIDSALNYMSQSGYLVGYGALSLLYEGGFGNIFGGVYGQHFFLSDVGLIGEFFRYGAVMYVPIGGLFLYLIWSSVRFSEGINRSAVLALTAYGFLASPLLGTFATRGSFYAIVLAIGVAVAMRKLPAQRSPATTPKTKLQPAQ